MAERITQRSGRFPESWRRVGTFLKPRNRGQPRGERACSYNESWRYTLPPRRQGALNRDAQRCKAVERNPCCVYIYIHTLLVAGSRTKHDSQESCRRRCGHIWSWLLSNLSLENSFISLRKRRGRRVGRIRVPRRYNLWKKLLERSLLSRIK